MFEALKRIKTYLNVFKTYLKEHLKVKTKKRKETSKG